MSDKNKTDNRANLIKQWDENHKEQGHYSVFTGFMHAMQTHHDATVLAIWDILNIYERIALYGFVSDLLQREYDLGVVSAGPK